jgi:hypothetical protein
MIRVISYGSYSTTYGGFNLTIDIRYDENNGRINTLTLHDSPPSQLVEVSTTATTMTFAQF